MSWSIGRHCFALKKKKILKLQVCVAELLERCYHLSLCPETGTGVTQTRTREEGVLPSFLLSFLADPFTHQLKAGLTLSPFQIK